MEWYTHTVVSMGHATRNLWQSSSHFGRWAEDDGSKRFINLARGA